MWALGTVYSMGYTRAKEELKSLQSTDDCFDTKKYRAYVVRTEVVNRCFTIGRSYPHRVRSWVISK